MKLLKSFSRNNLDIFFQNKPIQISFFLPATEFVNTISFFFMFFNIADNKKFESYLENGLNPPQIQTTNIFVAGKYLKFVCRDTWISFYMRFNYKHF